VADAADDAGEEPTAPPVTAVNVAEDATEDTGEVGTAPPMVSEETGELGAAPPDDPTEVTTLNEEEVKVSGQTVVETAEVKVTTVEDSGQLETEAGQLRIVDSTMV
jgi:hypothetical protein